MRPRILIALCALLLILHTPAAAARPDEPPSTFVASSTQQHSGPTTDVSSRHEWFAFVTLSARLDELSRFYAWASQLPAPKSTPGRRSPGRGPVVYGTGACGGKLPPCWVLARESGGNLHAYNPTGCNGRGCSGLWQCDPRSCDGTGSEEEQNAEAERLWDDGRGCSHWAACG